MISSYVVWKHAQLCMKGWMIHRDGNGACFVASLLGKPALHMCMEPQFRVHMGKPALHMCICWQSARLSGTANLQDRKEIRRELRGADIFLCGMCPWHGRLARCCHLSLWKLILSHCLLAFSSLSLVTSNDSNSEKARSQQRWCVQV